MNQTTKLTPLTTRCTHSKKALLKHTQKNNEKGTAMKKNGTHTNSLLEISMEEYPTLKECGKYENSNDKFQDCHLKHDKNFEKKKIKNNTDARQRTQAIWYNTLPKEVVQYKTKLTQQKKLPQEHL